MLDPDPRVTGGAPVGKPFAPPTRTATMASSRWGLATLSRAAVLVLSVAAAASATVPGSPVRNWITGRFGAGATPAPVASAPVESFGGATLATPMAAEMGVRVAPSGGRVRIVLTRPSPGLPIRATLTDSPRGWVTGVGEAASMRFQTGTGSVEVLDASADELRIEIPRSVADASVVIDGRTYVVKDIDQLRLITGREDTVAPEISFEVQP
jgi:hypothetical protein